MNDIIQRIQQDILDKDVSLSDVLLRAKLLAYQLKNDEFKSWVKSELDGYRDQDDPPDYRIISGPSLGFFSNRAVTLSDVVVTLSGLPEWLQDQAGRVRIRDSIRAIEELTRGQQAYATWPAEWIAVWNNIHCQDFFRPPLLHAKRPIAPHTFAQIITTVRSRLQDFMLEISDLPWNMSGGAPLPREEVQRLVSVYIYNHPEGGKVSVFDQRNQQVNYQYNAAGDINFGAVQNQIALVHQLEALKAELRKAGDAQVIDGEIVDDAEYQLTKAISQAKKPEPDKKTLVEHLSTAKTFLETTAAAVALVGDIGAAIDAVQKLF